MKTIILDNPFQEHIILYCKGWYSPKKPVEFKDGIRRIREIQCGLPKCGNEIDKFIANAMYTILILCDPEEEQRLMFLLHDSLDWNISCPSYYTPIQKVIWFYKERISSLQIKEGRKVLIKLPKPKKQLFNRIISGNGEFNDYYKIK